MAGRREADLDWKKIDDLLIAGCTAIEIAGYFGVERTTLYNRCLSDNEIDFSTYSSERRKKGDTILRAHQYAKALGKTTDGDNTLLIWLGKTRLKQERKEKQFEAQLKAQTEIHVSEAIANKYDALMDYVKGHQSASNNAESKNSSEQKS